MKAIDTERHYDAARRLGRHPQSATFGVNVAGLRVLMPVSMCVQVTRSDFSIEPKVDLIDLFVLEATSMLMAIDCDKHSPHVLSEMVAFASVKEMLDGHHDRASCLYTCLQ